MNNKIFASKNGEAQTDANKLMLKKFNEMKLKRKKLRDEIDADAVNFNTDKKPKNITPKENKKTKDIYNIPTNVEKKISSGIEPRVLKR
jgi:hypothetical protein